MKKSDIALPSPIDWPKSVVIDHADAIFRSDAAGDIRGEWRRRDLALIAATRVRASRFQVEFPPEPPSACWRIALLVQLEGICNVENGGKSIELHAGEWAWIDPSSPCSIGSDQLSQVVVEVPRRLFTSERHIRSLIENRKPSSAQVAAVIPVASALFDCISDADDVSCLVLAESIARMAALSCHFGVIATVPQDAVAILMRATAIIDAQFSDPSLCAELVARQLGFSRRSLDKLFSWRLQSADDVIRAARVQRAARMLAGRGHDFQTVAEVAAACGFSDQSSLTRSFKRHFGTTPTAFRSTATPLGFE
ncbi:MAG: helix-turn-helix domain-containing protein [Silanimonas sp.]|nr:helix-turn-helix domain-containing protein [Silanimonas sp.]